MNYNAVIKLVYDARKIALDKGLGQDVSIKDENDYVTAVDTGISDFIKAGLKQIAPNSAFVTEEESEHSFAQDRFILDPIDGTVNLVRGYNKSSISLAHYVGGEIVFGAVYDPHTCELFFALKGRGAHLFDARFGIKKLLEIGVGNYTGGKLSVSSEPPQNAIVEFGAGSTNKSAAKESFAVAQEVFLNCRDLRRICSTALSICYVASGRIEGYFERKIKCWDYAAGALILQEAGGKISQWNGEKLTFGEPSTIVAGNPKTHEYLLGIVKGK
jgi:myo-inositol-1(or 4)-monophosphatase